jgi:DNA polymerase V
LSATSGPTSAIYPAIQKFWVRAMSIAWLAFSSDARRASGAWLCVVRCFQRAAEHLFPLCSGRRYMACMQTVRLHDVPYALLPREVPLLLTRTPAGFPSPAQDDMEEPIDLGAWLVEHPAASYIMRVDGQSMAGAGINDGDLIVVNRAKTARAGSIVVALVHGDRTLKRLRKMDGRHWLVPEAEGYPHILVDEYVEIWGVVVGVARKVS